MKRIGEVQGQSRWGRPSALQYELRAASWEGTRDVAFQKFLGSDHPSHKLDCEKLKRRVV